MGDTRVPSFIVFVTAINQLETKKNLLPEAICCFLQTFNVAASGNNGRKLYTKSYCQHQYN